MMSDSPANNQNSTNTAPNNAQSSAPSPAPASGKSGSNVALIIIIVVLVLVLLGVGGYLVTKSLANKAVNKIGSLVTASITPAVINTSSITTTPSAAKTVGKISTKTVIDTLKYPGSQITDQKQGEDSGYAAQLTLSTSDSVDTIKSYYLDLISKNSWKITRQGTSGENNYYVYFSSDNFSVELDTTKYDGYDTTDIGITITGENLSNDGLAS